MSAITYDERSSTWLIQLPESSYGIFVGGERRLPRALYWGPPLDHAALGAIALAGEPMWNADRVTWSEEEALELVGWGGRRYDEPTLKVDFADGTRAVELCLSGQRTYQEGDSTILALELNDLSYPLRVELYYRIFDDCEAIERWVRLVHTGEEGSITVRQAHSANWWMPQRLSWRLTFLHGGWGSETQVASRMVGPEKVVLESRRGATSHQCQPWFALDPDALASEQSGEVYSGALAWSGSWKLVVETTSGAHVHVTAGWNDFDAPLVLAPGDEISLPVFVGLYRPDGFGGMSRAWHAYQLGHVLSRPGRTGSSPSFPPAEAGDAVPQTLPALRPVLYNSWEATAFAVSEEGQARLAERAAEMGVELFVVDDGWFVGRRNARAGLGDWRVDGEKFPRGLDPLIGRVNDLGMRFGIWVEPEMVNPDSDLYRQHPEWVLHFANRSRTEKRNQLILNLARPDVREWIFNTLDTLLSEHQINFVKWDMNRHFSEPGWPEAQGQNPERLWVHYVRHLYEILDRLRRAHPAVDVESCSGGGGRVDVGIMSRTQQVWTSDNTDAWDRVAIQEGFTYAHAPLAMMAWVTDSPNPLTRRRLSLRYRFHVAMSGSLGIGGNLEEWSSEELAEAKELVAAYKRIRPVVQWGRLYRLASTRHGPLGAVQYTASDGSEVVLLAWTGVRRYQPWLGRIRLIGLEAGARYREVGSGTEHLGAALTHSGLPLPEDLDFASTLVHLQRV